MEFEVNTGYSQDKKFVKYPMIIPMQALICDDTWVYEFHTQTGQQSSRMEDKRWAETEYI